MISLFLAAAVAGSAPANTTELLSPVHLGEEELLVDRICYPQLDALTGRYDPKTDVELSMGRLEVAMNEYGIPEHQKATMRDLCKIYNAGALMMVRMLARKQSNPH